MTTVKLHVPNSDGVIVPSSFPLCVVLRITVCHAVKPIPSGCLHMMGCIRPPKRPAGGPQR